MLHKSNRRQELMFRSTDAEKTCSQILTSLKVRHIKQYQIKTGRSCFFADIYIPSLHLVLEIDGGYHYTQEQKRKDRNRSAAIRRLGIGVCRLSNHDARCVEKIRAKLARYRKIN